MSVQQDHSPADHAQTLAAHEEAIMNQLTGPEQSPAELQEQRGWLKKHWKKLAAIGGASLAGVAAIVTLAGGGDSTAANKTPTSLDARDLNEDGTVDDFELSVAESPDAPSNLTPTTEVVIKPDSTSFFEDNLTTEQSSLLKKLAPYGYETTYDGNYSFDMSDPEAVGADLVELFLVSNNTGFSPQEIERFGDKVDSDHWPLSKYYYGRDPDNGSLPRDIEVESLDGSKSSIYFKFSIMYTDRNDPRAIQGVINHIEQGSFDGTPSQGSVTAEIEATISEDGELEHIFWQGLDE